MMTSQPVSTDPDVFEWCDEARIASLAKLVGPALPLLADSNLLRNAITFWIKRQVLLEFLTEKDYMEALSDRNKADQALELGSFRVGTSKTYIWQKTSLRSLLAHY